MNVGNISTSPLSSVFGSPPPSPKGIPRTEMMVPRHTLERGESSGGNHDDSSSEEGEGYGMEFANRGLMLQVEDLFRLTQAQDKGKEKVDLRCMLTHCPFRESEANIDSQHQYGRPFFGHRSGPLDVRERKACLRGRTKVKTKTDEEQEKGASCGGNPSLDAGRTRVGAFARSHQVEDQRLSDGRRSRAGNARSSASSEPKEVKSGENRPRSDAQRSTSRDVSTSREQTEIGTHEERATPRPRSAGVRNGRSLGRESEDAALRGFKPIFPLSFFIHPPRRTTPNHTLT
nr:hypothetical protein Iba_chr06aCG3220 [Ipomoea batatas]